MKKFILSLSVVFTVCAGVNAQSSTKSEKLIVQTGDKLSYSVNTGQQYDFIVSVKALNAGEEYPIVFDWKMTDPINIEGTVKISPDAAKNSTAMYNMFRSGEKILTEETSVFVSAEISAKLNKAAKGDVIKLMPGGAGAEEESYVVDDVKFPFLYKNKGETKTILTKLLRNRSNKHVIIIHTGETYALIVSMSIGFEIALDAVN